MYVWRRLWNLGRPFRHSNTSTLVLAAEDREGSNTQDRAEHLGEFPTPRRHDNLLFRQRHTRIVLSLDAREGPNTQDQAGRLIAETGHHLEDMIPPIIHLVLLAVFMTVGDADTLWYLQFFSPATFESQLLTKTLPWFTRVTPNGTVMFELASLVIQHFVSHRSTCTSLVYPGITSLVAGLGFRHNRCCFAAMWDGLEVAAWFRAGIPTWSLSTECSVSAVSLQCGSRPCLAGYSSPKVCGVNREVYYFPLQVRSSWSLLSMLSLSCSNFFS